MKTAVILTARRERQADRPYPLIPFDGDTCLIDRNLAILEDLGYTRIIIVAGYRAELFEQYKSENVQVLLNPDFEYTSSMASLAVVKDYVQEDFLLVEGDTFFERKVAEKLTEVTSGNCLAVTEESGSGDECYVESRCGFITKITKDRHRVCHFEGELIGVSRICLSTFRRMLSLWESSTNPRLNYEYILMDVTDTLDRPFIFFRNVIWGDVDTEEDLKRLKDVTWRRLRKKEDPFDCENLRQYLRDIFPSEDIEQASVVQIGGMSNKNFRVDFKGQSYVLRVPGNGSDGMVVRSDEQFNAMEGCRLGVTPAVRYFNPQTGIKLADYIEDAETLNSATIQRPDNMRKVADIYRTIHGAHIRLKNEFNIFREIAKYDTLLERAGAKMYAGWEEFRPLVMGLEERLNRIGVDLKPCHNDAVPENFVKASDGALYLIDWEYSGMNDPMADFAALFLESSFTPENQDYILSRYFDGPAPEHTQERILCYQILWDTLWAQWTVIKEAKGDDFGSYGIDRYNRAKTNINKL